MIMTRIIFLTHLFAVIWYSIGTYQYSKGWDSWIFNYEQEFSECKYLYNQSFYFAVITITTVGYGDIHPTTQLEYTLIIIFTLLSCANYAYTINCKGQILGELNQKKIKFQQKFASVNQYFKTHDVSYDLQVEANRSLEYMYISGLEDHENNEKSLNHLSQFLRQEILKNVYKKVLTQVKVVNDNFSEIFIDQISKKMKEVVYGKNQSIILSAQSQLLQKEPSLYFIAQGSVTMYLNPDIHNGKPTYKQIKVLKEGQYFGELDFFIGNKEPKYNVVSNQVTRIYCIDLVQFVQSLQDFKDDIQKYCMLRDSLKFQKQYHLLRQQCWSCFNSQHEFINCPYIFYNPDMGHLIRQLRKSENEYRKQFNRNLNPNFLGSCLGFLNETQLCAKEIQEDLFSNNSESEGEELSQSEKNLYTQEYFMSEVSEEEQSISIPYNSQNNFNGMYKDNESQSSKTNIKKNYINDQFFKQLSQSKSITKQFSGDFPNSLQKKNNGKSVNNSMNGTFNIENISENQDSINEQNEGLKNSSVLKKQKMPQVNFESMYKQQNTKQSNNTSIYKEKSTLSNIRQSKNSRSNYLNQESDAQQLNLLEKDLKNNSLQQTQQDINFNQNNSNKEEESQKKYNRKSFKRISTKNYSKNGGQSVHKYIIQQQKRQSQIIEQIFHQQQNLQEMIGGKNTTKTSKINFKQDESEENNFMAKSHKYFKLNTLNTNKNMNPYQNQINEQEQQLFFQQEKDSQFEKMCSYEFYYPEGNIENIELKLKTGFKEFLKLYKNTYGKNITFTLPKNVLKNNNAGGGMNSSSKSKKTTTSSKRRGAGAVMSPITKSVKYDYNMDDTII